MTMRELMQQSLSTEGRSRSTAKARTLRGYLATAGDPAKGYKTALDDATRKARTASGSYGTLAEALSDASLSGGGYHEHLSDEARNTLRTASDTAARDYLASVRQAQEGFSSYLAEQSADAAKLRASVKSFVTDADMRDYDEIVAYGMSRGLSEEDAAGVATEAIDAVRQALRTDVLKTVIREDMAREEAYLYAVAAGLDEQGAREIAALAQRMRESVISDTTLFN